MPSTKVCLLRYDQQKSRRKPHPSPQPPTALALPTTPTQSQRPQRMTPTSRQVDSRASPYPYPLSEMKYAWPNHGHRFAASGYPWVCGDTNNLIKYPLLPASITARKPGGSARPWDGSTTRCSPVSGEHEQQQGAGASHLPSTVSHRGSSQMMLIAIYNADTVEYPHRWHSLCKLRSRSRLLYRDPFIMTYLNADVLQKLNRGIRKLL
ncbi:MAG: hypothetical protein Q9181_005150 [Wetmoreana brouardii]